MHNEEHTRKWEKESVTEKKRRMSSRKEDPQEGENVIMDNRKNKKI